MSTLSRSWSTLRCSTTLVDPSSGVRGKEPLKTLSTYRRSNQTRVMFGQKVCHLTPGVIRVGDRLEVVSYQEAGAIRLNN